MSEIPDKPRAGLEHGKLSKPLFLRCLRTTVCRATKTKHEGEQQEQHQQQQVQRDNTNNHNNNNNNNTNNNDGNCNNNNNNNARPTVPHHLKLDKGNNHASVRASPNEQVTPVRWGWGAPLKYPAGWWARKIFLRRATHSHLIGDGGVEPQIPRTLGEALHE